LEGKVSPSEEKKETSRSSGEYALGGGKPSMKPDHLEKRYPEG